MASTQVNYTASKGGVFNGGFETGSGSYNIHDTVSVGTWIGSQNYGWVAYPDNYIWSWGNVSYNTTSPITGTKSLTINITKFNYPSGELVVVETADGFNGLTSADYGKLIPVKPSTTYRTSMKMRYWADVNYASNGYAKLLLIQYTSAYAYITQTDGAGILTTPTGVSPITTYSNTITTSATTNYLVVAVKVKRASGTFDFDDITLEEVVTNTQATAQQVKPVIQGVTSTNNTDQSLDPGFAQTNTYALGTSISETSTNWQVFTPTKSKITNISFKVASTGTSAGWNISVHDTSNNTLSANSFTPVLGIQSVAVPALWSSGNLHFHIISTTTTGAPAINATTTNDMDTASYIEYYAKNTEDVSVSVNGVNLNLTSNGTAIGDATGILAGAIVDTDRGFYNWTGFASASDIDKLSAIHSASYGGYTTAPVVVNGYYGAYPRVSTSGASTDEQQMTWKFNTMLPINVSTINSIFYNPGGGPVLLQTSNDNSTWTTIRTVTSTGVNSYTDTITGLFGNTTVYVRVYKAAGVNEQLSFGLKSFNSTLNTTGLPTQSVIAGTNYYNISSNGRADSASLDPSMQVNVWLMGQGSSVTIPIVQWLMDRTVVRVPGIVTVNDTSLNSPTSWQYYWADGQTNTTTNNATHVYGKRGGYCVSLNATNSAGSNTSACVVVKVIGGMGLQGVSPGQPIRETPISVDDGTYSSSRDLTLDERRKVECQLLGICTTRT